MREIKFRYWNGVTNIMVNNPEMPYKEGWTIEQLFSDRGWIWQQFTGLTDKNGKEIYEGDVVQFNTKGRNEMVYEVKWSDHKTGFKPTRLTYTNHQEIEVIGNVYENPHMRDDYNLIFKNPDLIS